MELTEYIRFANETPICYLATVEGDQPRVRALGFWFADETGFYFQTSTTKEIPHHLEINPKCEVCFYKHSGMIGTMMRITGKAEKVDDLFFREKALNDRPFLKSFGVSIDSPQLYLFRISHGEAHFWTIENNLKPKEFTKF